MSMAIKASRANLRGAHAGAMYGRRAYMGDPGLFGFLGKAAGTILGVASKILPGPVGLAAGTIGGAIAGSKAGASTAVQQVPPPPGIAGGPLSGGTWGGSISVNPPLMGAPGVGVSTYFGPNGGGTAVAPHTNGGPAPSGYHYNKSDYFLKDGTFVPKGTRLVKNRRRNPLNPRAASRAISRLESAKKATKRLDRISVKCRRCGYTACRCK